MLPPFVPPSARVSNETLPLITEFVVSHVEQSFGKSFNTSGDSAGAVVATLPSIDEFVREAPHVAEKTPDEFIQRTSRSPWGTYEALHEVSGTAQPAPVASTGAALEPDLLATEYQKHSGSEDAIVNETVEPAEAWAASAAGAGAETATPKRIVAPEESVSDTRQAPTPGTPEVWVAEERDAFDWHGVANLAVPAAEDQRAAEEWSATEWERSSGSVQDHVAALLAQVSRRVRSGELEVQGSKQMGPESALVAALAALLSETGKK